MSDLTLATQQFSTDDLLAQLAAEQGLATEVEEYSGSGRIYTNFTKVPGVRVMNNKSWQNSLKMEWNYPDTNNVESFGRTFPHVNEIEGFILHSELQVGLYEDNTDEDSTSQTKPVCTLVGYKNNQGDYIKKLPETLTYFNKMYKDYNENAKRPVYNSPNPKVQELGFLGSRGMSCYDCITSGKSTKEKPNSKDPHECKLRGRIFFYVTHLKAFFTENGKTEEEVKSVQELMGVPGFVMLISLPTSVGLKGKYDKKENEAILKGELDVKKAEKVRQCYLPYQTKLQQKYGKKLPVETVLKLIPTNISVRPPVAGETNTKFYLTFTEVNLFDKALVEEARKVREELFPVKEPEILDSSNWVINGVGGSTVYSSAKVDDSNDFPMIEAVTTGLLHSPSWKTKDLSMIEDAIVSDDEPDADIPF